MIDEMNFCGECGESLVRAQSDNRFNRLTGRAMRVRYCPNDHEGWQEDEYDSVNKLKYDDLTGWYPVVKTANERNGI